MKKIVRRVVELPPGEYTPGEIAYLLGENKRRIYVVTSVVAAIGYNIVQHHGINIVIRHERKLFGTSPTARIGYRIAIGMQEMGVATEFTKAELSERYGNKRVIYDVFNVMDALGIISNVEGEKRRFRINDGICELVPLKPDVSMPFVRRRSSRFLKSTTTTTTDIRSRSRHSHHHRDRDHELPPRVPLASYYNDMPDELAQLFLAPLVQ